MTVIEFVYLGLVRNHGTVFRGSVADIRIQNGLLVHYNTVFLLRVETLLVTL